MIHLTLVIPTFNESARLRQTFSTLNRWKVPSGLKIDQVVFINDGSTDGTLGFLKKNRLKFPKKIISYSQNKGKGFAVRQGMLISRSDYTLLLDADMATHPKEVVKFLPFFKAKYDLVIGTRKNGKSTVTIHQPWIRENMGKVFTRLSQLVLGIKVTDFTCGFKAFSLKAKNEIFPQAVINGWSFDSEVIFLGFKLGYRLVEQPVTWADKKYSKVSLFKDTLISLLELFEIKLNQLLNTYNLSLSKEKAEYTFN